MMMRLLTYRAGLLICVGLAGCATGPRPAVVEPVQIEDAVFTTRGPMFAPGLYATVRVCVAAQGQISSANVVLSSGDQRFDNFVLGFARRVQVRPQRINGHAVPACDIVRVEINHGIAPASGASGGVAVG
jgi:TonB family protein